MLQFKETYEVPRRAASPIVWAETDVCHFGAHTSEGEILLTSTVYRTPLIRINWDGEPFGYEGIPDNYIFPFENSAKFGTLSPPVIIYSTYRRLNLSTTPDLKF